MHATMRPICLLLCVFVIFSSKAYSKHDKGRLTRYPSLEYTGYRTDNLLWCKGGKHRGPKVTSLICRRFRGSDAHPGAPCAILWRSKAIITILQLRYNDILTVMSILKIVSSVSSYLLFVMSILISLCHNSEPLVHNSDRCFIIRTAMSIISDL
jgi:hypothetical protein